MRKKTLAIIGMTVAATLAVPAVVAATVIYAGLYSVAASKPHSPVEFFVLDLAQVRSVKTQTRKASTPPLPALEDAARVQRGFVRYRSHCVACHGAPGESRSRAGVGVNPNPPSLESALTIWSPEELRWIITNGIKLAGMPAFGHGVDDEGIVDLTAFVVRLSTLTPAVYGQMLRFQEGALSAEEVPWLHDEDTGWDELPSRGDVERGRTLVRDYGCAACHTVPGVPGARATVAAPLSNWKLRHYIAGRFINQPSELVRFIVDPQVMKPGTAMPDLDVSEQDAWHIARYLYTLE